MFNAINLFKVIDVVDFTEEKIYSIVKLEYSRIEEVKYKEEKTELEEELLCHHEYERKRLSKINSQGICLFECEEYKDSILWFEKKNEEIRK